MNEYNQSNNTIISTLIYIISFEMFKGPDRINTDTINTCTQFIQEIDPKYVVPDEKKESLKKKLHDEYHRINDCNDSDSKGKHHIKLSKKFKITIIAAVIAILLAGLTIYAFTDLFAMFFNDPKDILTWENGESRRINDVEMIVDESYETFDTILELKQFIDRDFICPCISTKEYTIDNIFAYTIIDKLEIKINYEHNSKIIQYVVSFNSNIDVNTLKNSSIVQTNKGTDFYLVELPNNYQADTIIDGNLYTIISTDKNELIDLIKKIKE